MAALRSHVAPLTALFLLIAAFVFTLLALSSANWSELRAKANGGECVLEHRGLWRQCVRISCDRSTNFKCYTTVSGVAGDGQGVLSSPDLDDWYYAVQVLETLALITSVTALVLWAVWVAFAFCCSGGGAALRVIKVIVFIAALFTAIFHFLGVVVWACKDDYNSSRNSGTWKLCWSFAVAVVACVLALASVVLVWFSWDRVRVIHAGGPIAQQSVDDDDDAYAEVKKTPPKVYTVEAE